MTECERCYPPSKALENAIENSEGDNSKFGMYLLEFSDVNSGLGSQLEER